MRIVVLKGGKGNKKKFNGSKAKLLRRNGGWIDAQLQDGTVVKWRAKSFDDAVSASTRTLESMPDDALSHILSFLFSGGPKAGWNMVAPALNSVLRLNKTLTRRLTASVLPKTSFCANLLHLSGYDLFPVLVGLTKYPFAFQALQITAGCGDLDFVATLFLHHFNMSNIDTLALKHPPSTVASHWYVRPRSASFRRRYVIDVDEWVAEESIRDYFSIPPDCRNMTTQSFQKNIVGTFQSLKTLRTYVLDFDICNADHDGMLQLPALQKVDLDLRLGCEYNESGCVLLSKCISEMNHLEHFVLRATADIHDSCMGVAKAFSKDFVLQSSSLRSFSLEGFSLKGFFVRKCICPNLERFSCLGSGYGNGVRPNDPQEDFSNVRDFPPREQSDYLVGNQPFFGMEVPSTCVVSFMD